jgi:hypothetical protein
VILFNSILFIYSLPLLLLLLLFLFFIYKRNTLEKLFLLGFFLKIIFSYGYAAAYQYYFKEGDTFLYFENASLLRSLFFKNPLVYLKILFLSPINFNPLYYQYFNFNEVSYTNFEDASEFFVSKFASLIMIFTGKSYLNVSLITSTINYLVSWSLFSHLREKYKVPNLILLPILLWPSLLFWASGINKEVIYVPCLYLIFRFLILLDFGLKQVLIFLFSLFLLLLLKPFIFVVFILSLILTYFINKIKTLLQLFKYLVVLIGLIGFCYFYFSDSLNYITLFQLAQENATSVAGGTGYVLNNDLTSISGFILLLFDSLLVSIYRPYLTEITNGITLLLSFESLLFFLLTLLILFNAKHLKNVFQQYKKSLIFILTFTILLSIIFGAISFNYGTLMRFKIVVTPLLFTFMTFVVYQFSRRHV